MNIPNEMKELAKALAEYKTSHRVSNRGLASLIGCSEGTVRMYLKAEGNPEPDTLLKIKRKLGIVVTGLTPEFDPDPWKSQKEKANSLVNEIGASYGPKMIDVPEYEITASMGPSGDHDGGVREYWPLAEKMLLRMGVEPAMAAIIPVEGNSMYDTLLDGDLALVDQSPVHRLSGRVYVLWSAKAGLQAKRLKLSPDGENIEVISDNPNKNIYPTDTFEESTFHSLFEIQGTVLKALFKDIPTI